MEKREILVPGEDENVSKSGNWRRAPARGGEVNRAGRRRAEGGRGDTGKDLIQKAWRLAGEHVGLGEAPGTAHERRVGLSVCACLAKRL